ncbi:MAG TPA: TonB-dependent receptor [Terriglobales bacterium]|nr:TonB-dependent receptor [Terriglobales bacterium]
MPTHKEAIVVTGTFEPTPLEEVERAVSSISLREMPEVYGTWVDYLETEPWVDLRQRSPRGMQGDLSIRGSSLGQTLVLVNGLRVNDVQTPHHNMDLPLPLESLDRIEVLRGTGSTLYGSDAVGGAVNFITRPAEASEFRVGTSIGSFGTNQQSASATIVNGRLSQQISFERELSTGFMPDRDYRNLSFTSDGHLKTKLGDTGVLLGYSDRPFGADQFYGNYNSWERTKAWLAALRQELGTKTEFDFAFRRHTDIFILRRDKPWVYKNDHATESWQAALRRREKVSQNGTVAFGGELYREQIDSSNLGQHQRNRGAVYANYDLRALKRFSFSLGAREEIYESTRGQFSPAAAGGYWVGQGLKARASVSRAFRLPTYTDLYYRDPANVGNPNLRPESAWSYEAGLDWDRGGLLRASATVFQRRDTDVIDYVKCGQSDAPGTEVACDGKWHAINVQNLRFTGIEGALQFRLPHRNRLDIAYAGLHGSQDSLQGLASRYAFSHRRHTGTVAWQGVLPGKVMARSRFGVAERYCAAAQCANGKTGSSQGDPYGLWDVALARQFGYVTARLAFSNLTDTRYEEIQNVVMPGRSVMVGLEFVVPKR